MSPLVDRYLALGAAALCAGCASLRGPPSEPGSPGMRVYTVGDLSFEVPASWEASGDAGRVLAVHPENRGRLEVRLAGRDFPGEAGCLAQAEEALRAGEASSNVRRHPTTFAGRSGLAMEADQGPWHGWAWAICDGPAQYRVSFFGATPLREDVLAAWTALLRSARVQR